MDILENVPLAPLTTLKIGGPARYFSRVTTEHDVVEAVAFARERRLSLYVLGGGSNLVVADTGFDGLVVQVAIEGPTFSDLQGRSRKVHYHVPSGTDWDDFVLRTCRAGFTGVECLAGIPGSVGGSPVQNIGAYGQEVSQTIHSVHAYDRDLYKFVTMSAAECKFGYRRSLFNTTHCDGFIVTRVAFEFDLDSSPVLNYAELQKHFDKSDDPQPMDIYEVVRSIRARKGMLLEETDSGDSRSVGSFFKNPVVEARMAEKMASGLGMALEEMPNWQAADGVKLSAAWLIERAGFSKGFELGRVGISSRHTLALVNRTGDATCAELMRLKDLIVMTVEDRFGVTLEQEPVMLG